MSQHTFAATSYGAVDPLIRGLVRDSERQRTIKARTTVFLSALAAVAIAATGCGGGDEPAAKEKAPTSAAPTESSAAPDEKGSDAPTDAKVTEPGTELKLGDRAVVPFKSGDKTGTIAITVTAIEKGDTAAFRSKFGERAKGIVPYYIRYTVENVDGSDLSYSTVPALGAVVAGGRSTGTVVVGDLTGCERGKSGKDFTKAGAKYETCRLQAAREGVEVAGAEYDEDDYDDKPILWLK